MPILGKISVLSRWITLLTLRVSHNSWDIIETMCVSDIDLVHGHRNNTAFSEEWGNTCISSHSCKYRKTLPLINLIRHDWVHGFILLLLCCTHSLYISYTHTHTAGLHEWSTWMASPWRVLGSERWVWLETWTPFHTQNIRIYSNTIILIAP